MPLKRVHSLTYRWLHVLQPDIIFTVFSSCSEATSSIAEAIELQPLFSGERCEGGGAGAGHCWQEVGTQNPTWCDLCGELIWGLYETGAWQCGNCSYTAHLKCRARVRLDCSVGQQPDPDQELSEEVSGGQAVAGPYSAVLLQDDTDGMVQSLVCDEEEESFSSYTTAKADQLTNTHLFSVTDTSNTLVAGDDEFHTLQVN